MSSSEMCVYCKSESVPLVQGPHECQIHIISEFLLERIDLGVGISIRGKTTLIIASYISYIFRFHFSFLVLIVMCLFLSLCRMM